MTKKLEGKMDSRNHEEFESISEKSTDDEKQEEKNTEVEIKFSRKTLIIILVVLFLGLVGLFFWQMNGYDKLMTWIMPAQVEAIVVDQTSQRPIEGVQVTVWGKSGTTDERGVTKISGLHYGKFSIEARAAKYDNFNGSISLKRGINYTKINLVTHIEKVTLQGKISDYINENPLETVEISTSFGGTTTDKNGNFIMENFPIGETDFKFTKSGYIEKTQKITVEKNKPFTLALTPNGKAVFVSSRDEGKRAVYSADYDGNNVKQLVKREGDTEDYNAQSNQDQSKVVFVSTRDKRKLENSATYDPYLYLIDSNGENLTLVSKDFYIHKISWANSSKYLVWISKSGEKDSANNLYDYNVASKNINKLNSNGDVFKYDLNNKGTALAWFQYKATGEPDSSEGLFYVKLSGGDANKISDKANNVSFINDDSAINYDYYNSDEQKTAYMRYFVASGEQSSYTPEPTSLIVKIASPDGKKFAYTSERDGKNDIYVSDADGKNEKRLTTMGTVRDKPVWDLTGNYILFDSSKTGETAKYIVGLTGKDPKKIADEHLEPYYPNDY